MKKISKIRDLTIAVTDRCNSRCQMCNIWQNQNPQELDLAVFRHLSKDLRYINLSGGEAFLRSDLSEIVGICRQISPRAEIIISSNGLATELITTQMKKIIRINPLVGVRISIDGLGEKHDQIRGIPGIYRSALSTIQELKKIGVKNLGISFTIMDDNIEELSGVYELAERENLQLAMALVQNSDIYFQKKDNLINKKEQVKKMLSEVIKKELGCWNIKRWLRAYYDYGLYVYADQKKRLLPSGAGFDSAFIDTGGRIYPSNLINLPMGNLKEMKLDDLWISQQAEEVRKKIIKEKIEESWIICTIRGQMKKSWLKVGWWILKNKIYFSL